MYVTAVQKMFVMRVRRNLYLRWNGAQITACFGVQQYGLNAPRYVLSAAVAQMFQVGLQSDSQIHCLVVVEL